MLEALGFQQETRQGEAFLVLPTEDSGDRLLDAYDLLCAYAKDLGIALESKPSQPPPRPPPSQPVLPPIAVAEFDVFRVNVMSSQPRPAIDVLFVVVCFELTMHESRAPGLSRGNACRSTPTSPARCILTFTTIPTYLSPYAL